MIKKTYTVTPFAETKHLSCIDEITAETLLFTEKLYVFNEEGHRIGRFSLKVDKEEFDPSCDKNFYVHISNRAFINGKLSESIVTGTVTPRLKILEEIRHEITEVSSTKHERIMFLLRESTKYYLSVTNKVNDVQTQNHSTMSFVEAIGLIGESSNAILMRSLAIRQYEGILCSRTLITSGKRCYNHYVVKQSKQIINGKTIPVTIIYRTITNKKKLNVTITVALTRAGQLLYLFWSNTKCFLHVDPEIEINPYHFYYESTPLHRYWNKDDQLHSLYLDKVEKKKMLIRSYKYEKEELKRILCDFVECCLLMKPRDIICFAIEYFTTFGHGTSKTCGQFQSQRDSSNFWKTFEEKIEDEEYEVHNYAGEEYFYE